MDSLINFTSTSSVRITLLLLKDFILFDISSGVVGDKKNI